MKQATVDVLVKYQGASLRTLSLGPYSDSGNYPVALMCQLQTLRMKALSMRSMAIVPGVGLSFVSFLVGLNCDTLRRIDLGVEITLVKKYIARELYDDNDPQYQLGRRLRAQIEQHFAGLEGSEYLRSVDSISLRGLDFSSLCSRQGTQMVNLGALKSLTLESCLSLDAALTTLGTLQLPGLEAFHIRQEGVNDRFFALLATFLCALPPLGTLQYGTGGILHKHGESLRKLIVDVRKGT